MDPQTQDQPQVSAPLPPEPQEQVVADALPQAVSALQGGKNVLVTVSVNPSVDELASALGLTFLLGKLDKHATAVFSGKIPPAMEFLDPEKTFEDTVDSLRDFIIALDKEKADKLRYKVEDDVVKIFITPYKTILSEKDLEFSQGDFNVDVVVALGVTKRDELDASIIAHGRILHDATVITINTGGKASGLGAVDWSDSSVSSIAEMVVQLSDALGQDLLDSQISTAFLTGIVAETNRFSNDKTSPQVMNVSARLMAAGANQQLIATNLRQEGMLSEPVRTKDADHPHDDNGEMVLEHEDDSKKGESPDTSEQTQPDTPQEPEQAKEAEESAPTDDAKTSENAELDSSKQLEVTLEKAAPEPPADDSAAGDGTQQTDEVIDTSDKKEAPQEEAPSLPELPGPSGDLPPITPIKTHGDDALDKPAFGGTLNATAADAAEARDQQDAREAAVNTIALSHDAAVAAPAETAALDEARQAVAEAESTQAFDPAHQPLDSVGSQPLPSLQSAEAPDTSVSAAQAKSTPLAMPEQTPVDAFMQPHTDPVDVPPALNNLAPSAPPLPPAPGAPAPAGGLPPIPPLPNDPIATGTAGLPPLPPLPGQPMPTDATATVAPQINPEFMQDMAQSQNAWTQAGDDLAAKQAEQAASRQQKMDQMAQQYDQAVDRNRELQGLPPVNNPNGSGLPPLPPA